MIWRLIARLCARTATVDAIIERALATPYRNIYGPDGELYMGRWWLFNPYPQDEQERLARSWWRRMLPSVRLHHICVPDQDLHMHDHPWNARTIILRGWYIEHRPTASLIPEPILREPGDTARLKFGEYHRINQVATQGCWTLFITWKFRGTWGFLVDGVKVKWRDYLEGRDAL